eukprot:12050818-Ditylum_brightwellii.AAC.1
MVGHNHGQDFIKRKLPELLVAGSHILMTLSKFLANTHRKLGIDFIRYIVLRVTVFQSIAFEPTLLWNLEETKAEVRRPLSG